MGARLLVSAGEPSGDLYASELVRALRRRNPGIEVFGCPGPRMLEAGVEPAADFSKLAVAGLAEVVSHIPGIYREYRSLVRAAELRRPDAAILTDSPDFHLRLARRLRKLGVPVIYLIAPQVWAWRRGRIRSMRRTLSRLLCIFPFEPEFFFRHGMNATYIGHPLSGRVRPSADPLVLRERFGARPGTPLIALLPGSRLGEIKRHLPAVLDAVDHIRSERDAAFALSFPPGFHGRAHLVNFEERFVRASIQVIEGASWDLLASADLALAASGTVTVEAALLGTPMVTFYKVSLASWLAGKALVRVPFYSMVNLLAGHAVVPELMQGQLTGARLAAEAMALLASPSGRQAMRTELDKVSASLAGSGDPIEIAAAAVEECLRGRLPAVAGK
jgi:lipid-A-disaccharide synthase